MYRFNYFKENDRQTLLEFIDRYPLAFVTGCATNQTPVATQVPLLLLERDGELYLQGHIMKNTDHHKCFLENPKTLVVFTGPNAYVSASWYSTPQIGSTWNYMSIHAHGQIRWMDDNELVDFMQRLTLKFEQGNLASPTIYENLPETFLQKMMPAIAGIEIKVDTLENVFKLSQNRDEASYRNIIRELELRGGWSSDVAQEMKQRITQLFPAGQEWDASRFES